MRPWQRIGIALVFAAMAQTSSGQAWIGQVVGNMVANSIEHQCMSGVVPPLSEEQEALTPGTAALQSYWTGIREQRPAVVLAAFHDQDGKARWRYHDVKYRLKSFAAIRDPFSKDLSNDAVALDAQPLSFKRSGDSGSAAGIWRVRNNAGQTVGWYNVFLKRRAGLWKIRELTVFDRADPMMTVTQYCHAPGDVEPYVQSIADTEAKRAAKKARKEAERARRASGT